MGRNDAASPSKFDRASSPVHEQPTIHRYPDWAAMQAYYGPGVAMTPPYFGTAVASGHVPHPYMWRPQPLMSPFGVPYAAIYPPGIYSNPSMPLGSHGYHQGIAPPPTTGDAMVMATPLSVETPVKSSSNRNRGLMKKLKGIDGLAVSVTNAMSDNTAGGATDGLSQSGDSGEDGLSDGSHGNNDLRATGVQTKDSEDILSSGKDGNAGTLANTIYCGERNATSSMSLGVTVPPANNIEKPVGSIPSSGLTPGVDLRVSTTGEVKASVAPVTPPANAMVHGRSGLPHELWIQDERELKRERRKQSNRESARRSRLRKQAETEELAQKVETLSAENTSLRSEIHRLIKNSEKLRQENTALMEKLQDTQWKQVVVMPSEDIESEGIRSVGTKNLLSKINNTSSTNSSGDQQGDPKRKLCQLLDTSPRTDAVAAG